MAPQTIRDRGSGVKIVGMREFRRELKALGGDLPKSLRDLNRDIAEPIGAAARASFASRRGVAPKVARTVRVFGQQTGAAVQIGGSGLAGQVTMGAEFGGGKYRSGRPSPGGGYTSQFEPWRGNDRGAGYSLYPAVRAGTKDILDRYGDRLEQLARRAFPD